MTEENVNQQESESKTGSEKIGAVMVVGGGIAAMQSSLDLADCGFQVHMVTNQPCIGGNMVRLDKVFPTNDCSMCIVSPKLVTVGNHPNINIVTMSDVQKIEGEPGRFDVSVNKRARYIDESKCTGCAECAGVCPVHIPNPTNEYLNEFGAAFRLYPQAVPNWFAIERERTSPCKSACPAHISCQGYVQLIAEGRFKDALEVVRARNPFPSVCGRVCFHPCEEQCTRNKVDEPVAINNLKRFISDLELEEAGIVGKASGIDRPTDPSREPWKTKEKDVAEREEKVAVIGAGPAGLTAAYRLAQGGFPVTVFERLPVAGGMLAVGIPEYRLPMAILKYEIERIERAGVEIKLNSNIDGADGVDKLFNQGFKAVYIAVGAHKDMKLGVSGEDAAGVLSGIEFLRKAKLNEETGIGKKVLVLGGGNVAIDCARTAMRLGASQVTLACLECREEMPAWQWEIHEAESEGVSVLNSWGVKAIHATDGRVSKVEFKRCSQVFDEKACFNPMFDDSVATSVEVDTFIISIGQRPDVNFSGNGSGVKVSGRGTVVVNEKTAETDRPGVFAGGDCARGPWMAIGAIADGQNAAVSIMRYLNGEDMTAPRYEDEMPPATDADQKTISSAARIPRNKQAEVDPEVRKKSFIEVEKTYSPEQAVAEAKRCLSCGPCSDCRMCEMICQQNAIDFNQTDVDMNLEVGAVILAPGFETFNPKGRLTQYGYGVYDNVYTSIEFERFLSASGPTVGHIRRKSDNKAPKNVAFIQCVGSRDATVGNEYCSGVCCMYTAKEAVIGKEHEPDMDCTVFCIDVRAQGKNFDRYYETAKNVYGVKYVRSAISGIKEIQKTKNLLLTYMGEDGKQATQEFEMVVLAVGLEPTSTNRKIADIFGVKLNEYGFCETDPLCPTSSGKEGIYVAGAFQCPKDIPDSVTQASGAACAAMIDLAAERGTRITPVQYPPERDVAGEEPRVGVMICRCGFNIGSVVDVPAVVEYCKTLQGVVHAEESLYTCSQDNLDHIIEVVNEHKLNRFVISSCTVQTHLPLFQQTMRLAGLNKYLFEFANIREHDSWVHKENPKIATEKAKELTAGAVARVKEHKALEVFRNEVIQKGLVIGGGPAGMTAALAIADQGFEVFLIEKESALGGNLINNIHYTVEGSDVQNLLIDLTTKVEAHPRIKVFKNCSIKEVAGHVGHYSTTLSTKKTKSEEAQTIVVEHGICIVASGGNEFKPDLPFWDDKRVMTQSELGRALYTGDKKITEAKNIVIVQCVDQRNENRKYCSKICCSQAVKNSVKIKDDNPEANVYVLYRDIRTYGFKELNYQAARDRGVVFIRFKDGDDPVISKEGAALRVSVNDDVLKKELVFEPDALVLSVPVVPSDTNGRLSDLFKIPADADGFFCEAHAKLRPVDFASEGLYLCGVAHSPKPLEENIQQARAAASRAMIILCKDYLEREGMVAQVNEELCAACLTCVRVCPYNVPFINERNRAQISGVECQGCGCCAAACPAKAIQVEQFRDDQIILQETAIISKALQRELVTK